MDCRIKKTSDKYNKNSTDLDVTFSGLRGGYILAMGHALIYSSLNGSASSKDLYDFLLNALKEEDKSKDAERINARKKELCDMLEKAYAEAVSKDG